MYVALLKRPIVLTHANATLHPSGSVEPSRADELLTQALKSALALVDVRVLDHLVVTGADTCAFSELGLLQAALEAPDGALSSLRNQARPMRRMSRANGPACRAAIIKPTWRMRAGSSTGAPGTSRLRKLARNAASGRRRVCQSCVSGSKPAR